MGSGLELHSTLGIQTFPNMFTNLKIRARSAVTQVTLILSALQGVGTSPFPLCKKAEWAMRGVEAKVSLYLGGNLCKPADAMTSQVGSKEQVTEMLHQGPEKRSQC